MSHYEIAILSVTALLLLLHAAALWWVRRFFSTHGVVVVDAGKTASAPVLLRKKHVGEARTALREKYAKDAVAYAEQLGASTRRTKLDHAVGYFQKMDESDNGHRDFTDAEIRLAIEARLGAQ